MIKTHKFQLFIYFICFSFFWSLSSCETVKREEIDLDLIPDPISFAEHISPIFEQKCIQCHNGTTPPDLSPENSFSELIGTGLVNIDEPLNSNIIKVLGIGGSMSQYANDLDRAYIQRWIESGAEEN